MGTINIVLVKERNDELVVLQQIPRIEVTNDADNLLEDARDLVARQFGARVHALSWNFPPTDCPELVLHVDESTGFKSRLSAFAPQSERAGDHVSRIRAVCPEPWGKPRWLVEMDSWVRRTFNETITISQVRVGSAGAVLRIKTSRRHDYYLKTVPHVLSYEVLLLQMLNEKLPNACARMLPARPDERTHVTKEVSGRSLASTNDLPKWKKALRGVAQIQIQAIEHVKAMRTIGVPYRSLAEFSGSLRQKLFSLIDSQKNCPGEMNEDEQQRVDVLIQRALGDCEILSECNLPETLINNDLNQTNIFIGPRGAAVLIDWTFARISHPFFTLHGTLFGLDDTDRCTTLNREILAQEYLSPWQQFSSIEVLLRGFRAASRLVFVQVALNIVELAHIFEEITASAFSSALRQALKAYNLDGE